MTAVVEIIGGLGNQMFQYAFKMAYDAANNTRSYINIKTFDTYETHKYQLDVFNIAPDLATQDMIAAALDERRILTYHFPFRFRHKIITNRITEPVENVYAPELLQPRENAYFVGYFQSEKYFRHLRPDVLRAFSLKVPLNAENKDMLAQIQSSNAVSVHVRRGDYLNLSQIYGSTDINYYKNAIEHMQNNIKNAHFFVFSNDIPWCRKNISVDSDITFVNINDGDTGYFDLELMRNCKHNIIANSTFSWWGAWLNENPDKIVIAPQNWFADGRPTDIIPDNWVRTNK